MGFLDKFTAAMGKVANCEADIIEAGGWGNKAQADMIRTKEARAAKKAAEAKGNGKKK